MSAQDPARLMMGAKLLSAILPVTCGFLGVLFSNLPVTLFGGLVPPPCWALSRSISGAWCAPT